MSTTAPAPGTSSSAAPSSSDAELSGATFRLVLLVSCAHALVHVYELAYPAVEQLVGETFGVDRAVTGGLGSAWRVPFGIGALAAGWLVDRYGAKPLLLIYLFGCAAMSVCVSIVPSISILFAVMLVFGSFGSIYHPAGLALISRVSTPATRGKALGWHGILGSIGIASAPFLASAVFGLTSLTWRGYYLLLAVPGLLLGLTLWWRMADLPVINRPGKQAAANSNPDERLRWGPFLLLVLTGTLTGFIYAGLMNFLPRYIGGAGIDLAAWVPSFLISKGGLSAASQRNLLAGIVLLCGAVGQWLAGRWAKPGRLEALLVMVLFANAPLLLWMALASGPLRMAVTCLFALFVFMNQPIYNSLIAQYVPAARRSLGYGFSNLMCFGVGGLGPTFIGAVSQNAADEQSSWWWAFVSLATIAVVNGLAASGLWYWMRKKQTDTVAP